MRPGPAAVDIGSVYVGERLCVASTGWKRAGLSPRRSLDSKSGVFAQGTLHQSRKVPEMCAATDMCR